MPFSYQFTIFLNHLGRVLQQELEWLISEVKADECGSITSFQRVKSTWKALYRPGMEVTSLATVSWADNGHSFVYSPSGLNGCSGRISIQDFRDMVHQLFTELKDALVDLLGPFTDSFPRIKAGDFVDQVSSPLSVFCQNPHLFEPILEPVQLHVLNLNQKDAKKWIAKQQNVLELIAVIFLLTCSILPWAFQVIDL